MTLGLAQQHQRLAQALAQTGITEKSAPAEYQAQAQVTQQALSAPIGFSVMLVPDLMVIVVTQGSSKGTSAAQQQAFV